MSTSWVWDPTWNQYRIWSPQEQCWVLQDGRRLPSATATQQVSPTPAVSAQTTQQTTVQTSNYNYSLQQQPTSSTNQQDTSSQDLSRYLAALQLQQQQPGSSTGQQETGSQDLSQYYAALQLRQAQANAQQASSYSSSAHPQTLGTLAANQSSSAGAERLTVIHGTTVDVPRALDDKYRRRDNPRKFFTVGRVFKVFWPEHLGDENAAVSVGKDPLFGQEFAYKIRWFVVVKEHDEHVPWSTCVPIQTYAKKGVAKYGVNPSYHAIIFTGEKAPSLQESEKEATKKKRMQDPIRVIPKSKGTVMDRVSRINYDQVHTIQHYAKVFEFGKVHPQYLHKLIRSFLYVWQIGLASSPSATSSQLTQASGGVEYGTAPITYTYQTPTKGNDDDNDDGGDDNGNDEQPGQ